MGKGLIGSCLGTGACFDLTNCFLALFGERNWIIRPACKLDGARFGTGACFDSTTCFSAWFGERNWIIRPGCSAGKLDSARFGTSGRVEVFRYDREK